MQAYLVFVSVIIPHDLDRWSDIDATCGVVMRYWSQPVGLSMENFDENAIHFLKQKAFNDIACKPTAIF